MTVLTCEVRGPSRTLPPQTAVFDLALAPVWKLKGSIGPRPLSARALDLLDLAGAIYRAESQIRRRLNDPPLEWKVVAPVRDAPFWRDQGGPALARVLGFLNRANWTFDFQPRAAADFEGPTPVEQSVDAVMLFSGGMDSLCGAGLHESGPANVALASFYHKQATLQDELAKELGYAAPARWRLRGRRGKEGMNLIRSLMFLVLGAAVAETYGASRIFQYENGVLATAIPPAGNFLPTRHAHPETHRLCSKLFSAVFGRDFEIENPFLPLTKREIGHALAAALGEGKAEALLRRTETCWYHQQPRVAGLAKRPGQPCGGCTPCLVRRTARPTEATAGAWPDWPGYAYDLADGQWQGEEKLGTSFRGYLELIDIILSQPDDLRLLRELSPEARLLVGGAAGPSRELVCGVLRRFTSEFCETFGISPSRSP